MPKENKQIVLRSEEVQEILTKVPHWTIRWGNLIILILIVLVFLFSYFIKYPDIIAAPIVITTENPPQRLIAKNTGRIEKIFVVNKDTIKENTPVAVLESTAYYKDVFRLKNMLDTLSVSNFEKEFIFPFHKIPFLDLGKIQQSFNTFENKYIAYNLDNELNPTGVEENYQSYETSFLQNRQAILSNQKKYYKEELELKRKENKRYQKLYEKGAISSQEWEAKNTELIQAKRNYQGVLTQISQLNSSLNELNKNTATTKINAQQGKVNLSKELYQSFSELKNEIDAWEVENVFRSSIKGQVSFMKIWSNNQMVNTGDFVFTIIPIDYGSYVGRIEAELRNSGKIKIGQRVNIHLDNYPDNEFGVLKGKIKSISLIPNSEGKLYVDVSFPNMLKTSYDKEINFSQEMTGQADIVTEDLRLIERFFYQFRGILDR